MMVTSVKEPNFTNLWYIYYNVHVHDLCMYIQVLYAKSINSLSNVVFSHMLFDL